MRRGGTAGGLGSGPGFGRPSGPRGQGRGAGSAGPGTQRGDEVIFEFIPAGRYVKVTAMHARTLTEVSVVGDASRSQAELEQLALSKLRYVLAKNRR